MEDESAREAHPDAGYVRIRRKLGIALRAIIATRTRDHASQFAVAGLGKKERSRFRISN
jgi:hypothetical protein